MIGAAGTTVPPHWPSAVEHIERALATVVILARVFSLAMLVGAIDAEPVGAARFPPLLGIVAVACCETVAFVLVCWRRRAIPARLALVDMLTTAATMWPGVLLLRAAEPAGAPHAASPTYNYLSVAIYVAGLAPWGLPAALGVAGLAAAAALANMAGATGPDGLAWSVTPDVVNPLWATLIAWVIAASLRTTAGQLDEQRRRAVRRASQLAEERERARQAEALRGKLLSIMDDLAHGGMVVDPRVRGRLRAEADWLHRFVSTGSAGAAEDLLAGLRQLTTEKSEAGLRITARLPADLPTLPRERTEALLGAAREALTNVGKHAGVAAVRLVVRPARGGITVEVADDGRGFDPTAAPPGMGHSQSMGQRLAEVGGCALIESAPDRGTRVRLWVPAAR